MAYEWTPGALDRLRGIEPFEVLQVLYDDRPRRPAIGIDDDSSLRVMTVWGRTRIGRALIVVARQVTQWEFMIIGARDMRPEEVSDFEKWEEQR